MHFERAMRWFCLGHEWYLGLANRAGLSATSGDLETPIWGRVIKQLSTPVIFTKNAVPGSGITLGNHTTAHPCAAAQRSVFPLKTELAKLVEIWTTFV